MPRVARIVLPNLPHHVVQRGNNRQDVFFVDDDRRVYLSLLGKECRKHGLRVLGYCLMTNHVHLVAIPPAKEAFARAVGRADFVYTQYVNRLHDRCGHLWQNRFFSCALDELHLLTAAAYVDRNPVRAGLVRRAWDYPWSSARAHLGRPDPAGLLDETAWHEISLNADFKALLMRAEKEEDLAAFRQNTRTGRPLGSDSFLSKLEVSLGRRLRPLAGGRPKGRRDRRKRRRKN
jgi:putative transposase